MKKIIRQISEVFSVADDDSGSSSLSAGLSRNWIEGDLWSHANARPASAPARSTSLPREFDFSATEIIRPQKPHPAAARTQAGNTAIHSARRAVIKVQHIARFLEVNQTVKGENGFAYRIIQAIRGPSASYDLWKGPTRHVTFLLG